ncbi:unnamed protein product, partial [Brassica rapa]
LLQRLREDKASSSSMAILARIRINAQDFKSTKLTVAGETDNYLQSNVAVLTASEFPDLNILGLSVSPTDLEREGSIFTNLLERNLVIRIKLKISD